MGYPNKRVSMTDVHGEPQQGGYLPAEIWHDYMAAVTEGQPCVPFPEPHEQISYQPFFGKYQSMGHPSGSEQLGGEPLAQPKQPAQHHTTHHTGTGAPEQPLPRPERRANRLRRRPSNTNPRPRPRPPKNTLPRPPLPPNRRRPPVRPAAPNHTHEAVRTSPVSAVERPALVG